MTTLLEKIRSYKTAKLFTLSLRYLIGGSFVFFSSLKANFDVLDPSKFTPHISNGPVAVFHSVMQFSDLWYGSLIVQFIAGTLLLTQRFATFGALIFFPTAVMIFLMITSVGFVGTVELVFLMLLSVCWLIIWDYRKFQFLLMKENQIKADYTSHSDPLMDHPYWIWLGFAVWLVCAGIFFYRSIYLWAVLFAVILLLGSLGFFMFRKSIAGRTNETVQSDN